MYKNKSNDIPLASKSNTVLFGKARFQFLTERMIRLEWNENSNFEDRATLAVVNRNFPQVKFIMEKAGNKLILKTSSINLEYIDNGKSFSSKNLSISFEMNEEIVCWHPGLCDNMNLGGTIRTLDGVDGKFHRAKQIPNPDYIENEKGKGKDGLPGQSFSEFLMKQPMVNLGNGLISKSGWSIIDDSKNIVIDEAVGWIKERQEGENQDIYFLAYGHDYKSALADSADVFGRQPLVPRYSLGYWWSRYWAYTDMEIEDLVDSFDNMKVPIDVMVIDMDWHLEGWTGYTWDKRYFPDPEEFLGEMKRRNMKVTLNLHPADGVAKFEEQFEDMAEAMDIDKAKIDKVDFDITDPKYMKHYFEILHHPNEKLGVDFWWMDWQQGESTAMKGLDTLPWINHLHWKDMENNPERQNKRPLIFSRYGGIGAGRYCIGFSGDAHSTWDSLAFQPYFTATASNVLYGYWSHDIGGHHPGPIDAELYTRWMQYGTYSPILRTHTSKNPNAERRVWEYPDPYNKIMMDSIRKRYELVPYIYTENRKAFDNGISLCRPMYYDYPECIEAYKAKNQYMFGDKLLVAPIVNKLDKFNDMVAVSIWLPEGKWFDTTLGSHDTGGKLITKKYMLDETPVFVRPGTIIPGQVNALRLDDRSIKNLLFTIYDGDEGQYSLYEDDGITVGYETGEYAEISISHITKNGVKKINIEKPKGSYKGFETNKSIEIRIVGAAPPKAIKVLDNKLKYSFRPCPDSWNYNGTTSETVIFISERDILNGIEIEVELNKDIDKYLSNGLKGFMNRVKKINYYNTLATSLRILHENERLGVEIAQAGNRISRNPELFEEEVIAIKKCFNNLEEMLNALADHWAKQGKYGEQKLAFSKKAIEIIKNTI